MADICKINDMHYIFNQSITYPTFQRYKQSNKTKEKTTKIAIIHYKNKYRNKEIGIYSKIYYIVNQT